MVVCLYFLFAWSFCQGQYHWWNEKHNWDGVTHWLIVNEVCMPFNLYSYLTATAGLRRVALYTCTTTASNAIT